MTTRRGLFWAIALIVSVGVLTVCTMSTKKDDARGPADDSLTAEDVRRMANSKLVCVRNNSTFPITLELRSRAGHVLDKIHVQPHSYTEEWVRRDKFTQSPVTAVIDPTGADEAIPPQFQRIQVLPNGRNIELTVANREGGITAFAHSSRNVRCGEDN